MRKIFYCIEFAAAALLLTSCGSSKKLAQQSPIETFSMPCVEYTSGEGALRAWASGKSDNQMAARKKAQVSATAQLAAMLEQTIETTTKEYTSNITDNNVGGSKSLLNEVSKVSVKKSLQGATILCDKWTKDEATGQYTNYIVMELKGETYLESLYSELSQKPDVSINKEELEKLFMKHINEVNKQNN